MAFDYGFGPGPVIDPETGELVTSATGQVYAAASGGEPLLVRQGAAETTNIQTGSDGMVQQFFADLIVVYVEFPGVTRFMLYSPDYVVEKVEQARDAAVAAQGAAEDARDAAQQAAGDGGVGSGILTLPVGSDTSALPEGTVFGFYTPPAEGTSVDLVGYKTTTASTATTSITLDPSSPSGGDAIGVGDAMVAVVATNAAPTSPTWTAPAGWTQMRADWSVNIGTMAVGVWVKIRQAGEADYVFQVDEAVPLNAALMWVRGATPQVDEWIIGDAKGRADAPTENTTCTAPAITATQAPLRVLALSFERTSASESSVDWSWSAGEEWFFGLASGSAITTIAVASKVVTSTGSSDVATCTYPNPQSVNGWAFQLGIPAGN